VKFGRTAAAAFSGVRLAAAIAGATLAIAAVCIAIRMADAPHSDTSAPSPLAVPAPPDLLDAARARLRAGEINAARDLYFRALRFAEQGSDQRQLAAIHEEIGALEYGAGRLPQARTGYATALQLFTMVDDKPAQARAARRLAALEYHRGRYLDARGLYRKALTAGGDDAGRGRLLANLADSELQLVRLQAAGELLDQAKAALAGDQDYEVRGRLLELEG
jgi:tetratricopeptide (TPR) repeat protein